MIPVENCMVVVGEIVVPDENFVVGKECGLVTGFACRS